jgi:predicted acetyltransferase
MIELVRPSVAYRESFLAALREFHAEGRNLAFDYARLEGDFARFVGRLLSLEDRASLPPHLVPETIYWLVADREFVGRVSLRHELNEALRIVGGHIGYEVRPSRRREGFGGAGLGLVLPKARERGLARVLVTCDADNVASRRIIERWGGRLEEEITLPGEPVAKRRYWIDLG